ncbi:MAG: FAD/NAD(P)-binding oxidoreductase [Myxococcales bacterium]|nr:FAD/NAD(P)-binding oxidoreductase [Myxococcales bacterium]
MKSIVILGAGTAGTIMANRLRRALPSKGWRITVVDRDDEHVYQPGLLFVPFGDYRPEDVVRPRRRFLAPDVQLVLAELEAVEPDTQHVRLVEHDPIAYDVLIIATGCRIAPEQTPGLMQAGWRSSAHEFYTLEGAVALRDSLARFERGRLVVNVVDNPIKCPVAPLEFLFLADAHFRRRGVRDQIELVFATPLDGAFTKPIASAMLGDLLNDKGITVVPDFGLESVDSDQRVLQAYDDRRQGYDLLVSVPLHQGSDVITRSGLGDDAGFVPTDHHTLQCKAHANVFALGDATDLPASKAGAVAHFQSEVLTDNVLRYIAGQPPLPAFDGHANCFIETGHGKAMLIDFNYDTEPLPGRFPLPGIGPFTLLAETRTNHWGKLAFKWAYWNKLLPGEDLPLDHRMLMAGKRGQA